MNEFYNKNNPIFIRELEQTKQYPELGWRWQENIPILSGRYYFYGTWNNIKLNDDFFLQFYFPPDYPDSLPFVIETEGKIPAYYHRSREEGWLCLASPPELYIQFNRNRSLKNYIENLLNPYLYRWLYLKKFNEPPWGERSHYEAGIIEGYKKILNISNEEKLLLFLEIILKNNIQWRQVCPCGSNLMLRKCHKKQINFIKKNVPLRQIYEDFMKIRGKK